jgi:hypothetical protein
LTVWSCTAIPRSVQFAHPRAFGSAAIESQQTSIVYSINPEVHFRVKHLDSERPDGQPRATQ